MNVRIASATTIRSGVITSRTDACVAVAQDVVELDERRDEPVDLRRARPRRAAAGRGTRARTAAPPRAAGSRARRACRATSAPPPGTRAAAASRRSARSRPRSRPSRPSSTWSRIRSRLNSSSPPGGTVSSSAAIRSTPRSISIDPSHACTAVQWRSSSSCADTCCAHSLLRDLGGLGADAAARARRRASAAGSVDSRIVRCPAAAQRRAVAAATDVLPTPPLPV